MKVLIMSDSHGWQEEVQEIIHRHHEEVEGIIHCGDSELSASSEAINRTAVVRGNCDMDSSMPEERVETFGDLRFFISHGHLLNVKTTEMNLVYRAAETDADVVCFGHTHQPAAVENDGRILINPGSMRLPRGREEGTYVILEKQENGITVQFYTMEGESVDDLSTHFAV
ncbi:metallophosphoesterase family protein [Alkalicoccus urumqiensis]|uniref:Phosphoesterase n=1 Tax=Alkalicoccus urumqiensis TaxID=1548213 RepID=A0A2P6MF51_ALKUR|nr:metallophosphoesterase [Alkalicoccus urumqiensis]PRO64929.1 YfcE family phosphodiesterase [Alkalicoccus urumqiensis]